MKVELDHLYLSRGGRVVLVDWQQMNGCFKVSPYDDPGIYLVDDSGCARSDGAEDRLDLVVDLGSRFNGVSNASAFVSAYRLR